MSASPTTQIRSTSEADEAAVRKAISSTSRPPRASAVSAALTLVGAGCSRSSTFPSNCWM